MKHGYSRYKKGCRCEVCVEANREYVRRWRANRCEPPKLKHAPPGKAWAAHGTKYRYTLGCRCDSCKAAAAEQQREWRRRRVREIRSGAAEMPDHEHGSTTYYYEVGCRHESCVEAMRAHWRSQAQRQRESA